MSEIINIASYSSLAPVAREAPGPAARMPAYRTSDGDTAEFSRAAEALARTTMESSFRLARTRAIRAEIENGTFVTPERIHGTVERLLDVIV